MLDLYRTGPKIVSAAAGFYLVRRYVLDRLDDLKDKLEQDRVSRHNLRSRFHKTHEDISFTILALISALADQILHQLNIESVIQELQALATLKQVASTPKETSSSSLSSSVEILDNPDTRSDADSSAPSVISASSREQDSAATDVSTSGLQQWVQSSQIATSPSMTDSVLTTSSLATGSHTGSSSLDQSDSLTGSPPIIATPVRTKAELWNQLKIMTFTRTLTALYSTTLLSLLTVVQLTVLARYKYLRSVQQMAYEEQMTEILDEELSMASLIFGASRLQRLWGGERHVEDEVYVDLSDVCEEAEGKYLTLSWWILHVGWKDIGERVHRAAEEVLNGVSLKSKWAALDLCRLINDIRHRVDLEITFEGLERRVDFLSSLLPPTAEMMRHVLNQGGYNQSISGPSSIAEPHSLRQNSDTEFWDLYEETISILRSSDFSCVLDSCLARSTEILFTDLEESVFAQPVAGEEVRIQLAALLPRLATWSQSTLRAVPNETVDGLLGMRDVAALSAIIFSKVEDYVHKS